MVVVVVVSAATGGGGGGGDGGNDLAVIQEKFAGRMLKGHNQFTA